MSVYLHYFLYHDRSLNSTFINFDRKESVCNQGKCFFLHLHLIANFEEDNFFEWSLVIIIIIMLSSE